MGGGRGPAGGQGYGWAGLSSYRFCAAEVREWGGAGEALLRGAVEEVLGCFRSLFNLREVGRERESSPSLF